MAAEPAPEPASAVRKADPPSAPPPDATVADPAIPGSTATVTPSTDPDAHDVFPLAAGATPPPANERSLAAVRLSAEPKIDGELDDPVWKEASITGPFTYQNGPPAFPTVARFGYTEDTIYIAWQCFDAQPDLILAQQTKRDGDLWKDDRVSLGIDVLNDKRNSYWFGVNPLGTTNLEVPGGSTQNVGWRGDWKAAAKKTATGWQAEMAIPFALLRYPSGQSTFGLIFRRSVARIGQESSWPQQTSYHNKMLELEWQGLKTPKVHRKPVFLPYTLFGSGSNIQSSAGLDIKYTTDQNITNLLTFRPDFQTVEDAVQTVDFSYNQRFVPDRRPFFTEGGNSFQDSRLIYGRRINKVDVGLKSFGKIGKFNFGAFDTIHFGGDNNLVANFGYDLDSTTNAGVAFAHHRGEDGLRNTVLRVGADRNWQKKVGGLYFNARGYKSLTSGGDEGGDGWMYQLNLDRYAGWGHPGWHIRYSRVNKDFFPALGFLNEKNYHGISLDTDYGREYKRGFLQNWRVNMDFDYYSFEDTGKLYRRELNPEFSLNTRNHLAFEYGYRIGVRVPHRDRINDYSFGWKTNDIYKNGGLLLRVGRLNGGRYRFYGFRQGWRFTDRWSVSFSHERYNINYPAAMNKADDGDSQTIYGLVYDITPERSIAGRLRVESGQLSSFLAYRQELRNGSDAYLIMGDPNSKSGHPFKRLGLKIVNAY
ncbi:MAG: carbohydrate binding family 9 domain-containing protein [Armatimonadetes bacterium]|nr:carbohydrate binding family 9 domain-containing protein [Armatimonadota bacterium]